jgi:hypothetical protein
MTSKIRVKIGDIEIDYEGADDFLKKDLLNLIKNISEINIPEGGSTGGKNDEEKPHGGGRGGAGHSSTAFFAHKIGAKSGSDLILAASYHMAMNGKESFSSTDIITEMRNASAYFKKNYVANLSKYLKTLSKSGQLNESGKNKYSLSPEEVEKAKNFLKK